MVILTYTYAHSHIHTTIPQSVVLRQAEQVASLHLQQVVHRGATDVDHCETDKGVTECVCVSACVLNRSTMHYKQYHTWVIPLELREGTRAQV